MVDYPCNPDCTVTDEERKLAADRPSCEFSNKCVSACAAYGKVCPCAARISSHYACDAMKKLMEDSAIFLEKPNWHHFDADEIKILDKIGEGGFSNVNLATVTSAVDGSKEEYAIKYLKRRAMVDLHQFKHGAADLATEAFFLHNLSHTNIVKLHGISAGSIESNVATGRECGFFIVIDRLVDTLETRIDKWREVQEQQPSNILTRMISNDFRERKKDELMAHCRIALSIAEAMKYLHSKNIIYRDLKPDNIGFDKDGVLKVFDFGLAKELKSGLKRSDGRYELTGNTGSRRYMAPEVAKECPYDLSVDVYSFGILMWELCSLEKPFYGYSSGKHMQLVVLGGERPKMDNAHTQYWPANLQYMLKKCWSSYSQTRPSFDTIIETLVSVLHEKSGIPPSLKGEDSESVSSEGTPADISPPSSFTNLFRPAKAVRSKTSGSPKPESSSSSKNGRHRARSYVFRR